jgi:amino acid transporter
MKKNIGTIDRLLRLLVGVIIGILYVTNAISGALGIAALVLGIIFIATSVVSICPIYLVLGLNTCSKDK